MRCGSCLADATQVRSVRRIVMVVPVFVVAFVTACSPPTFPSAESRVGVTAASSTPPTSTSPSRSSDEPAGVGGASASSPRPDVVIDDTSPGTPIDDRLFGTNVPAWLGPDRLQAEWFLDAIDEAGVTTLRMPGGSWSNEYGWSACELRSGEGCIWNGAARPSDYAGLLTETGLDGIWTVSINETAQSAAALVAFFNGDVDDGRVIGVDRNGDDWGTVGEWARIRAAEGHAAPVRIGLWEVGNEVFGGRPDAGGSECAAFGWEVVWTCDGTTYVLGDDAHDGYLAIRAAMLDVDPSIEVGAVGVADAASWGDWGNEVIDTAAGELDFYVVHAYGFDVSPDVDEAVSRPMTLWPDLVRSVRDVLPSEVLLALTEYNLVSFEAGDTDQSMIRAYNALYIASTIGQLAEQGVQIANQWNLANGTTSSGTDYGLVDADTGEPFPQFTAMAVWGRAGRELLDAVVTDDVHEVQIYPTRRDDGSVHVIVVNTGDSRELTVAFAAGDLDASAARVWSVDAPDATVLTEGVPTVIQEGWSLVIDLGALSLVEIELGVRS